MRKSLILFFLSVLAMVFLGYGVGNTARAADEDSALVGKVYVHYMSWEAEEKEVGIHVWDNGTDAQAVSPPYKYTGKDDFGYVMEVNVMSDASDNIGIIVIKDNVLSDPWNNKDSADMFVNVKPLKEGITDRIDVYYFSGGVTEYFVADPEMANVFALYYDPSGSYEDKLGVHAWGFEDLDSEWGTPREIFKDGFKSPGDTQGKVAHMKYTPGDDKDPGFLIYAGSDANKKHAAFGDIKEETVPGFSKLKAGEIMVIFVTGGNVFAGVDKKGEFIEGAFTFGFQEFQISSLAGTFAKNPTTIFARFTLKMKTKKVVGKEEITELIDFKEYFTLKEGDKEIPIKAIYFNTTAEETNEFVLELDKENKLDNKKKYTLYFDNQGEGNEHYQVEIELDLDTQAPVITLVTEDDVDEVIITIPLGSEWDNSLFPIYRASDDRDKNLSSKVYVPEDKGFLSTKEAGTYEITLQVEDEWGNVGTATFKIVVAPRKGCKNKSANIFLGLGVLGLGLFLIRRRRFVWGKE